MNSSKIKTDDDFSILSKMKRREKYGLFIDFIKNPFPFFEQKPMFSFLLGFWFAGFVFIAFYFSLQFLSEVFLPIGPSLIFSSFFSFETVLIFTAAAFFLPFIWFENKHRSQTEFIEERIPEFLRDLSNLVAGGLTLSEAFSELSEMPNPSERKIPNPADRIFNDEIRLIGLKMKSGLPFDFCLENFGKRYDSTLIQRAASVIAAAEKSGGLMSFSIEAAVFDLQETVHLKKERDSKQSIYAIVLMISFLLFIGIVLLLIRQFEALSFLSSQNSLGVPNGITDGVIGGTLAIGEIFYHLLLIQAGFSGLMIGKLKKGKIAAGLKYSFLMIFIVWFSFIIGGVVL